MRPKVSGFLFVSLLCCVCLWSILEAAQLWAPSPAVLAAWRWLPPDAAAHEIWKERVIAGGVGCDGPAQGPRSSSSRTSGCATGGQARGVLTTWP